MRIETKKITLIATLAAVYAVGTLMIPGFPIIGVEGSSIPITRSLEMGYGIILGPILGPLTAFIGAFVGKLPKGGSGIYYTPLAPLAVFMSAALGKREVFKMRGWMVAAAVLTALLVSWYGTKTGRAAFFYPILHIISLGIILVLRGKFLDYLHSKDKGVLAIGIALCGFVSTMAGHMLGNLITILLFKLPPEQFIISTPVYIAERSVLTIISTAINTPLIFSVRSLFPDLAEKA